MQPDTVTNEQLNVFNRATAQALLQEARISGIDKSKALYGGLVPGNTLLVQNFPREYAGLSQAQLEKVTPTSADLYHVVDEHRVNGTVLDLALERVMYSPHTGPGFASPAYRIYGSDVVPINFSKPKDPIYRPGRRSFWMTLVSDNEGCYKSIFVNPNGSVLRRRAHGGRCPVGCDHGWLRNLQQLEKFKPDITGHDKYARDNFRPLCPVCFGRQLAEWQLQVATKSEMQLINQSPWSPWPSSLRQLRRQAPRVASNAYGWHDFCGCFDCLFPPVDRPVCRSHAEMQRMLAAIEAENDWEDDPRYIERHPASEEIIADLPCRVYGALRASSDTDTDSSSSPTSQTACTICQEDFEPETWVLELPCGHVLCHKQCSAWLRAWGNCPVCRFRISTASSEPEPEGDADDNELFRSLGDMGLIFYPESLSSGPAPGWGEQEEWVSLGTTGIPWAIDYDEGYEGEQAVDDDDDDSDYEPDNYSGRPRGCSM